MRINETKCIRVLGDRGWPALSPTQHILVVIIWGREVYLRQLNLSSKERGGQLLFREEHTFYLPACIWPQNSTELLKTAPCLPVITSNNMRKAKAEQHPPQMLTIVKRHHGENPGAGAETHLAPSFPTTLPQIRK